MESEDNLHASPVPRAVAPLLEAALRTMRVVVITGPRQAGKSTLARHPVILWPGVPITCDCKPSHDASNRASGQRVSGLNSSKLPAQIGWT